jgi:hypothetical protein
MKNNNNKNNQGKWTGGVVQCILCKHKALSSDPSLKKKKKKAGIDNMQQMS